MLDTTKPNFSQLQRDFFSKAKPDALDRFRQFHADNPHVYEALVALCRRARERGFETWSIKAAFEVLRWESYEPTTGEEYKLPNTFTALYARLIMQQEEDLAGFFVTRRSRFAQ